MDITETMPEGIIECHYCDEWARFILEDKISVCEDHAKGHRNLIAEAVDELLDRSLIKEDPPYGQ